MAKRHQPNGSNTHDDMSAAFPDNPGHGDRFDSPNGLSYYFWGVDDQGNPISPGYWKMAGHPGPVGPEGPKGPSGLAGSYPTINEENGCWELVHKEYAPNGDEADRIEETGYPAQGTVRVLGVTGTAPDVDKNPSDYNLGDAFYHEIYDEDNKPLYSELYVVPYHNHTFLNGNVDTSKNTWCNCGHMGGEGPRGEQGPMGPIGPSGEGVLQVVDFLPRGEFAIDGKMYLETSTKTIFVYVGGML